MIQRRLKVCLTGGPSAGKSTVVDIIRRELSHSAEAIPEVASLLYRGGFPRSASLADICSAQRAIYVTQVEMEKIYEARKGPAVIICDRGTMDQMAYWPHGAEDFLKSMGTTLEAEVKRYDLVLHLHTSAQDYDVSNPVRTESVEEALRLDRKIYEAWKVHPNRIEIPSRLSFAEKIGAVFSELAKREIFSIPSMRLRDEQSIRFS